MLLRKFTLLIAIVGIPFSLLSQELRENSDIEQEIIDSQSSDEFNLKNASSSSAMRLDSIIEKSYYDVTGQFVNDEKHVLSFDDDNNVTLWMQYAIDDVTGDWIIDEKEEFFYDEQGNEVKNIDYAWDSEDSEWEPQRKTENVYNVYGDLTQFVYFNWDTVNNSWLPDLRRISTYDTAQNIIESNYNIWNASTDSWDNYFIRYYGYDSGNNPTLVYRMFWSDNSGVYKKVDRSEFTYDNGLLSQIIRYDGDTINDVWVEDSKTEFSYNSSGNRTQNIFYEMESSWQPKYKTEYTYDNAQNPTLEASFDWDDNQSSWVPYDKYEKSYDASGNRIEMMYSRWRSNTDSWESVSKYNREYDNTVTYSDLILPGNIYNQAINAFGTIEEVFNHQLVSRSEYDWNSTDDVWDGTVLEHFYYTEQTVNIASVAKHVLSLYPNPVSNNLHIESDADISAIRIIDAAGKYVRSENTAGNKEMINLSGLTEGIYFVRLLLSNGETETKRIIKD